MNSKLYKVIPLIPVLFLLLSLAACGGGGGDDAAVTPAPEFTYTAQTLFRVESTKENAIAALPSIITDTGCYAIGGRYENGTVPEGAKSEYEGQFDKVTPCISFIMNDGTVMELSA